MKRRWPVIASGLLIGIGTVGLTFAPAPEKPRSFILAADEGDVIGNHHIKADPKAGSMRLGVGLQHFTGGKGIPLHMHEKEDEVLFIHSGMGMGVVGKEVRNLSPGTTLYIPQGTWHGIEARSDEMQVLWVVSPPEFAKQLREIGALQGRPEKLSATDLEEIAAKHGYRDARYFFAPRLSKSRWNGGTDWGTVVFSQSGTEMEFSRNGVPGRMQLQDDFPGGLGVQGEWSLQSGEKGPFALFFDFATSSKITLEWGPKLERSSEWTLAESQK
jgi:mannose-6-phosphate isomerase-like protein (cupin superfamily)